MQKKKQIKKGMYNQNVVEKIFNLMEIFSGQMLKMQERIK